jgi:hypothetical protein
MRIWLWYNGLKNVKLHRRTLKQNIVDPFCFFIDGNMNVGPQILITINESIIKSLLMRINGIGVNELLLAQPSIIILK